MAGANTDERNLLIAIECASDRMAAAAGGTPVECGGNDKSFNLLVQIAQNLKATITGLGGSVGFQDYTSTLGLWQTIQCETAALTGLTGTSMNYPGWVNEDSAVNAVVCNLSQVDTNTGASVEEENISDYVPGLETIACLMNQIADNGFAPPAPPAAPTGLIGTSGENAQVTLLWNASATATSYSVYRSTVNGGPYTLVQAGIATLGFVDTGRTNSVTYYYVVTAVNAGGESGQSNQTSATPQFALESHYDASVLTPGAIVTWANLSGIGSSLAGTATVVAAAQNGLNGVAFDGLTNVMSGTLGAPVGRTCMLACASTTLTNMVLNIGATANGILRRPIPTRWSFFTPGTDFGSGAVTVPGVMTWTNTGTLVSLYYDGVFVTSFAPADANGLSAALFLGANTAVSQFRNCTIFELKTWGGILTAAQILAEATALKSKWALP